MNCKLHLPTILHWGARKGCELGFVFFHCKRLRDGVGVKGRGDFF